MAPSKPGRKARRRRRLQNKLSLREAVRRVTSEKAMTKLEILEAVRKLGYKFLSKNPLNSLGKILYSKKQFKKRAGKFSPA